MRAPTCLFENLLEQSAFFVPSTSLKSFALILEIGVSASLRYLSPCGQCPSRFRLTLKFTRQEAAETPNGNPQPTGEYRGTGHDQKIRNHKTTVARLQGRNLNNQKKNEKTDEKNGERKEAHMQQLAFSKTG